MYYSKKVLKCPHEFRLRFLKTLKTLVKIEKVDKFDYINIKHFYSSKDSKNVISKTFARQKGHHPYLKSSMTWDF